MTAITQHRIGGIGYLACSVNRAIPHALPLVLLHGIGSNADCFRPLMQALASPYACFAWNAPGYMDSEPLTADWPDASDYAAALNGLLDRLAVGRCVLLGHSLGTLIAARFALLEAKRVAALFLVSPALGYGTRKGEPLPRPVAARLEGLDQLGAEAFAAQRAPSLLADPDASLDVLRSVRAAMAAVRRPGYDQAARLLAGGRLLDDAAKLAVPVAVLTGVQDRITPPEHARRVYAALTGERERHAYGEIPGAGHAVCQEKPQETARLIGQFVERNATAHA
jgi:pimeloyl-ACP methyl ester carboxylesterase